MEAKIRYEKEKNYITREGFNKLQGEYDLLWKVERPKVTETVNWAASNGDRSENADYIYGKRRLREIDRRLRFLKKRMELAVIVDPQQSESVSKIRGPKRVQFGAIVTVEEEDGEKKTYTIVGVDEIDSSQKKISWKSPLGHSLIGKFEGDSVVFLSPKGEIELSILKVEYNF